MTPEYQTRCAVRCSVGVTAGAIYDVIVQRACGDSDVMIAFREIAAEAGVSVRTVRRGIQKLCESGWLKRESPQTADGGGQLLTYFTIPTARETEPTSG
jgi:predicted transcriptional regulator